jgi:hypothetical protein
MSAAFNKLSLSLLVLLVASLHCPSLARATIIGVDFGPASSATPTNWNLVTGAITNQSLIDEAGNATAAAITVSSAVTINTDNIALNGSYIPSHTPALTDIGGFIYIWSNTVPITVAFSGLAASTPYKIWVLGGGVLVSTQQTISIQNGARSFVQNILPWSLAVNASTGSSSNTLESYALLVDSDASGRLSFTASLLSSGAFASLAGAAIERVTPSVTTGAASSVTGAGATVGGTVSDSGGYTLTARGICIGTTSHPTTCTAASGASTGSYSVDFSGLNPGTSYYARAYASNYGNSTTYTSYGEDITFATPAPPTVSTGSATNVSVSSATVAGEVTSDGGATVTERGVCLGATAHPTARTPASSAGTGAFTVAFTALNDTTTYYARAYATNSAGTNYGEDIAFTTPAPTPLSPWALAAFAALLAGVGFAGKRR